MAEVKNEDRSESSDYSSEDEGTDDYRRGGYHAVRIGDTFKGGCYVVQSKLGWGHFSTVWLAWDTQHNDHLALMMELLGMMPRKIALGGRYSREFFNRHGDLRHIRRLRFWPLDKVLTEKYSFSEQDANDMANFLIPILDFVPEKRPTAAQLLLHPWLNAGPRLLEPSQSPTLPVAQSPSEIQSHPQSHAQLPPQSPSKPQSQTLDRSMSERKKKEKDDREAMEAGIGNIAIGGASKSFREIKPSGNKIAVNPSSR